MNGKYNSHEFRTRNAICQACSFIYMPKTKAPGHRSRFRAQFDMTISPIAPGRARRQPKGLCDVVRSCAILCDPVQATPAIGRIKLFARLPHIQRGRRFERASLVSSSRERGTAMDTSLDAENSNGERSAGQ